MRAISFLLALVFLPFVAGTTWAAGEPEAWAALQKGGYVIIMRHAAAPGPEQGREGDPPEFKLGDCSTQRNLDGQGRQQATEIGNALRAHNVVIGKIMTSPWCRAMDTARLMNLSASHETTMILRNIGEHEGGAGQVNRNMPGPKMVAHEVREIVGDWKGPGNLLMVSHGRTVVDILWGDRRRSPEQAVMYVLEPTPNADAHFRIVGSIAPSDRAGN